MAAGIRLPGWAERLLNDLGYQWPEISEGNLFELGNLYLQHSSTISDHRGQAHGHAQQLVSVNAGDSVDAFSDKWQSREQPHDNLDIAQMASTGAGIGMYASAAIVIGLKVYTIVQLVILAVEIMEAIATAPETFGGSLAEIPVFKEIQGMLINLGINEAINALLSA
jgi:hypothetical protein